MRTSEESITCHRSKQSRTHLHETPTHIQLCTYTGIPHLLQVLNSHTAGDKQKHTQNRSNTTITLHLPHHHHTVSSTPTSPCISHTIITLHCPQHHQTVLFTPSLHCIVHRIITLYCPHHHHTVLSTASSHHSHSSSHHSHTV